MNEAGDNNIDLPYLEEYGLSFAPFADDLGQTVFFGEASRKQRLDLLQNLTQYSHEFLLLTGAQDSGKSTLLQQLIIKPGAAWQVSVVLADSLMDVATLLRRIASGLNMSRLPDTAAGLSEALRDHAQTLLYRAQQAIVIVDDAHLLMIESLAGLIELNTFQDSSGAPLLRVILAGEPSLARLLTDSQQIVPPKSLRKIDLTPFTEIETAHYIRQRLMRAGLVVEGPFSDAAMHKIHKLSGGLPGAINHLAHQLLLDSSKKPARRFDATAPVSNFKVGRYVLLGMVSLIAILALIFQSHINDWLANNSKSSPIANTAPQHLPLPPPDKPEPDAETASEDQPVAVTPGEVITGVDLTNNKAEADQAADVPAESSDNADKSPIAEESTDKSVAAPASPVATLPQADAPLPTPEPATTPAKPATEKPAATTGKGLAAKLGVHDAEWLQQQSSSGYTLQLLGAGRESTIEAFAKNNKLGEQAAYYQTQRKNSEWHVLVYGIYANQNEAITAAKLLPKQLAVAKPWPRPLADIHTEISHRP